MMSVYLGIDTSNYTTSAALFDCGEEVVLQEKKLLPVKKGEKGLRQSDALFHHTLILPDLVGQLMHGSKAAVAAVGVSATPRDCEGSYMPCFLAGINAAGCIGAVCDIPVYRFSHQAGHIISALYSANRLNLVHKSFIAFHISGGTTEVLFVQPDKEKIIKTSIVCDTLDLNAGQAVDRIGVMLGFGFPCGPELEKAALNSSRIFKIKPSVKNGRCSFSGLENKCAAMLANGDSPADISRFCIEFITGTLEKMAEFAIGECGKLPIVFSGGVMSNDIIKQKLSARLDAVFAKPEFSSDSAAGTAILASMRHSCGELRIEQITTESEG
jgi:N6-L-threonylcarbamoyladenine synthase